MDSVSKKDQLKNLAYKDTLAQPLKLKESLKIRDGLGASDVHAIRWPKYKVIQLTTPDLGLFWVSNN